MKTTYIPRIISTLIASSLLVVLLSLIPMFMKNDQGLKSEVSVFRTTQDKILTEGEIVNYFSNYPLRCEVSHIEWRNGLLYLQIHQFSNEEELYKDVYLILKECFVERTNVKRVRFSVHSDMEESVLLEAKREDVATDPRMEGRDRNTSYKEYLQQLFKLQNNAS